VLVTVGRGDGLSVTLSQRRFIRWVLILMLFFTTSVFWFRFALVSYSTSAIDHFEQSYAICLPFMSSSERDEIRSDFARIRTKADYVSVLARLDRTAHVHNIDLPKFSVW